VKKQSYLMLFIFALGVVVGCVILTVLQSYILIIALLTLVFNASKFLPLLSKVNVDKTNKKEG